MSKLVAIAVIAFLIIGGGSLWNNLQNDVNVSPQPTDFPTRTPVTLSVDNAYIEELGRGGSSYGDPSGRFSFLYPNDYSQDLQNEGRLVRVFKQGPTQTGQTEMYDGVIINFEPIDLAGKSLEEWVDAKIAESTTDGTTQVVKGKEPIQFTAYPGYQYTLRGLGEFTTYVIQRDANSQHALSLTTLVADPGNLGFQKQVDAVFSTIQLLK